MSTRRAASATDSVSLFILAGCDKGGSGGAGGSGSAASTTSLLEGRREDRVAQPAEMRGDAEKKLWKSMCAEVKPDQKDCVLEAGTMDNMKKCMK